MTFISRAGPNFNWPGLAVQYNYRLYEAKRDCTPNELSPYTEFSVKVYP